MFSQLKFDDSILSQASINQKRERESISFDIQWVEDECLFSFSDLPEIENNLKDINLQWIISDKA